MSDKIQKINLFLFSFSDYNFLFPVEDAVQDLPPQISMEEEERSLKRE